MDAHAFLTSALIDRGEDPPRAAALALEILRLHAAELSNQLVALRADHATPAPAAPGLTQAIDHLTSACGYRDPSALLALESESATLRPHP